MARSEYQKRVKAINDKMSNIYSALGTSNSTLKTYQAIIDTLNQQGVKLVESKSGIMTLSTSEKGTTLTEEQLKRLENLKSLSDIKQSAKERLQASGVKKPTKSQVIREAKASDEVKQLIDDNQALIYTYQELRNAVKRRGGDNQARLYSEELELLKKAINGDTEGLTPFDPFTTEDDI